MSKNNKTYVIAEAGVNHNGDPDIAHELIEKAKYTGADCIKFQTYKTERIVSKSSPKASYQLKVTDPKQSQFDMLKSLELELEIYTSLIKHCNKIKIDFMSTPYSYEDVDFLVGLNVNSLKIASGQLFEIPFLKYVAKTQLPIYLSTGMATYHEVLKAVDEIKKISNSKLTILQCTTNYPSLIEDANINVIETYKKIPNIHIGYSDHVTNNFACYAAVAKGAEVIEKHFTLNKKMDGPDHSSSLNPSEFRQLVIGIREVEKALGSYSKKPTNEELKNIYGMKRSLVYKNDFKKGKIFDYEDFEFKRPFNGISPNEIDKFIGKELTINVIKDEVSSLSHIK